jgi:hypothetical protein
VQLDSQLTQSLQYLADSSSRLAHLQLSYEGVGKTADFVLPEVLPLAGCANQSTQLFRVPDGDPILHSQSSQSSQVAIIETDRHEINARIAVRLFSAGQDSGSE